MQDLLSDALIRDTARFGLNGARTLEYLGLVFHKGALKSTKVYHDTKQAAAASGDWTQTLYETWLRGLGEDFGGNICDFSKAGTEEAPTYRMIVRFPKPLTSEQVQALSQESLPGVPSEIAQRLCRSNSLLADAIGGNNAPLIQVGIELDAQMQFQCLKYYLTVKPLLPAWDQAAEKLVPFFGEFGLDADQSEAFDVSGKICGQRYSPTFLCVNDDGAAPELKLYFISDLFGRQLSTMPGEQIRNICDVLDIAPDLRDELLRAWEQSHVYPEGIAATFGDSALIRMYLKELSAAYFK